MIAVCFTRRSFGRSGRQKLSFVRSFVRSFVHSFVRRPARRGGTRHVSHSLVHLPARSRVRLPRHGEREARALDLEINLGKTREKKEPHQKELSHNGSLSQALLLLQPAPLHYDRPDDD